ncbi:MAG TPA: hypothetical protein DC038_06605, partial [Clostridiales bacterium]|nr:hypothetical protein [Clostridiales bacterium]
MLSFDGFKINSIDYILIVDKEFTVVYSTRYDRRVNPDGNMLESKDYLNKNLFEVYPSVKKDANTSSIVKCITTGEIVVKKFQKFKDFHGNLYCTHNVTIPLIRNGKINGAIELVKDIKTIENITGEKHSDY